MGLDIVEVVMRCEEHFDVRLDSARLAHMDTVGDLFELIAEQLQLPPGSEAPEADVSSSTPQMSGGGRWSRITAWRRLVNLCSDQLQVSAEEVRYTASFVNDLGAD